MMCVAETIEVEPTTRGRRPKAPGAGSNVKHAALVLALAAGTCLLSCGKNVVVTEGSYLGFEIGSTKAEVFKHVLELQKRGKIQGYVGIDKEEVTRVDESTLKEEFGRLVRHDSWQVEDAGGRRIATILFSEGRIDRIAPEGRSSFLEAWSPGGDVPPFTTGMQALEAFLVLETAIEERVLGGVAVTTYTITPVTSPDSLEGMEPWDTWIVGNSEYDRMRLDFEHGRLVKIHHKKGGLLNWLTATPA